MAQYGPSLQTAQITTGNVRTTVDAYDSTKLNNGAKNPLGASYYDNTVSLANPNGVFGKFRYVRYNSVTNAAVKAFPGVVFWADNTYTTVTSTVSEAVDTTVSSIAGYLMPNSTDISGFTAALLNGNYVWIQVGGWIKGAAAAASTAVGDAVIGLNTWVPGRTALNTAPLNRVLAWALTAVASNVSDMMIVVEGS